MEKMFNLTQHKPTEEQVKSGVIEPTPEIKKEIVNLLTFDSIPSKDEILRRARSLAEIVPKEYEKALIGGALFLMGALESELRKRRITPLYAFTKRVVEEKKLEGGIQKTSFFKHLGFIEPP